MPAPKLLLEVKTFDELHTRLPGINVKVPGRASGRKKEQVEAYSMVRILGTLPRRPEDFPLRLHKAERPDFILQCGSRTIGVEHTEAISANAAKEAFLRAQGHGPEVHLLRPASPTELPKSSKQLISEIEADLSGPGWEGDSVERGWANAMARFISEKLSKASREGFRLFDDNWLVVYDNWPAPALQREHALTLLRSELQNLELWQVFARVFILDDNVLIEFFPEATLLYKINHCRR